VKRFRRERRALAGCRSLLLVRPAQENVYLAAELRLPVMYERPEDVEQGGLVSIIPIIPSFFAAEYVVRILSGTKPGSFQYKIRQNSSSSSTSRNGRR
jgi:hypothetical protein